MEISKGKGRVLDQPTILIVSDDAAFAHSLKARWQAEAQILAFTLMGSDLCRDLDLEAVAVAVVGPLRPDALPLVLNALEPGNKPVLVICESSGQAQALRNTRREIAVLVQQEGWQDAAVMIASEIIRRLEAVQNLRHHEKTGAALERQAALGSYILEMRHTLNNALTSILGNAELLLLEPEGSSTGTHGQIETIRNMAVRIHEILARFTSIDKELSAIERPFEAVGRKARAQASGTIH